MSENIEIDFEYDNDYIEHDLLDIEINTPISEEDLRLAELEELLFQEERTNEK